MCWKMESNQGRLERVSESLSTRLRACWLTQPPIAKQKDLKVARVAVLWLLSAKCRNRLIKL